MVQEFLELVSVLKSTDGLRVITSSWLSVQKDWPLPAVVVDIEAPTYGGYTEDGVPKVTESRSSIVVFVKQNIDPEKDVERLGKEVQKVMDAITANYSDKDITIENTAIDIMPFGVGNEALGLGFQLTIGEFK